MPRAAALQATTAADARADSYAGVAAFTFIAYDTLIHLPDEIHYIWQAPNTWVNWAYLFIRYVPIFAEGSLITIITSDSTGIHFTTRGCRDWVIYQGAVVEAITIAVEVILVLRVYALYGRSQLMLAILGALFIGEVAVMINALCHTIPRMTFTPQCIITGAPSIFMSYWLSSLAFETILFALTLYKFFRSLKMLSGDTTILVAFVRDGTWAYALIFVTMLLNSLMYQYNKTPLAGICYFWAVSVFSFAGSHVLLNIRKIGRASSLPQNSSFWSTGTEFEFTSWHISMPSPGLSTDDTEDSMELRTVESSVLKSHGHLA
ncbi:hypothetical protein OBBRIDRAFT_790388 [Obba rivulosa]|uniref:DUF6533 domain-containing protein n=1 Tax=Obba rivulosa TaxID=1052685 RepID=A0A8E2DPH3_9APHY|nr:hypothetical protein OBBRIDRAFT_790388 [Obba rivulosa]